MITRCERCERARLYLKRPKRLRLRHNNQETALLGEVNAEGLNAI